MTVLTVTAAGVRNRRRWLFEDLNVTASAGDIVAIVGPPGSGRTTVLLSLARRFRLSAGRVEIAGTAAVGFVPGVSEPEPVLTVAEHVRERALLTGRRHVGDAALHGLDPNLRGMALGPYQKQVLGIVLAQMSQPQIVGLDAVDEGLDAGEREALWALIGEMAAAGTTVLVTARDVDEARVTTVIRLVESSDSEARSLSSDVDESDALEPVKAPRNELATAPTGRSVAAEADEPEAAREGDPEAAREDQPEAARAEAPKAVQAAEPKAARTGGPACRVAVADAAEPGGTAMATAVAVAVAVREADSTENGGENK